MSLSFLCAFVTLNKKDYLIILTQHQRFNYVDAFISACKALPAAPWTAHTCPLYPIFSTPAANCRCYGTLRPTFVRKVCHKLPSVISHVFILRFNRNFVFPAVCKRRRINSLNCIIFIAVPFSKVCWLCYFQHWTMFDETTASQIWLVFSESK